MPNPTDPDEHECRRCHDTGVLGDDSLCDCVGGKPKRGLRLVSSRPDEQVPEKSTGPTMSEVLWAQSIVLQPDVVRAIEILHAYEQATIHPSRRG